MRTPARSPRAGGRRRAALRGYSQFCEPGPNHRPDCDYRTWWRALEHADTGATDQGNLVLDCHFGTIADPAALADQLAGLAGVVEHGLFVGLATDLVVAEPSGVRHLVRTTTTRP